MTEKPDYVKNFNKPKNTEIKHINGHWYLYERFTTYDPGTKKSKKVSGKMLGKITPDGFAPCKVKVDQNEGLECLEYGASQYFHEISGDIREALKEHFPDEWRWIYATAIIRTVYGSRLKRVGISYDDSFLSISYPGLRMNGPEVADLFRSIGRKRSKVRDVMRTLRRGGKAILIDGHRILSASRGIDSAEEGYDSKCRYRPQLNVVYSFSVDEKSARPDWFKRYAGSITDSAAIMDFLDEAGIEPGEAIIVGDKGTCSDSNLFGAKEMGIDTLFALKRDSSYAKGKVPASCGGYEGYFSYHDRPVFHKELDAEDGKRVFLFMDESLRTAEIADLMARTERGNAENEEKRKKEEELRSKGKGRMTDNQFDTLRPTTLEEMLEGHERMGTIILETTRESLEAHDVFILYKERQAIEVGFRTLDNELDGDASYMQDEESFDGWLFMNHLSLLMANETIARLQARGVNSTCSFKDVRQDLAKIKANYINGHWVPTVKRKRLENFCKKIGFDASVITLPLGPSAT